MTKLVSLNVSDIIDCNYQYNYDIPGYEYSLKGPKTNKVKWKEDNTYCIIFSLTYQQELYNYFKANCGGFDILYESKPALNKVHPGENRNVLIIFEVQRRFFGKE